MRFEAIYGNAREANRGSAFSPEASLEQASPKADGNGFVAYAGSDSVLRSISWQHVDFAPFDTWKFGSGFPRNDGARAIRAPTYSQTQSESDPRK